MALDHALAGQSVAIQKASINPRPRQIPVHRKGNIQRVRNEAVFTQANKVLRVLGQWHRCRTTAKFAMQREVFRFQIVISPLNKHRNEN